MKKRYLLLLILTLFIFSNNVYAELNCKKDADGNTLNGYELVGGACIKVYELKNSSIDCKKFDMLSVEDISGEWDKNNGYKGFDHQYCIDVKLPNNSVTDMDQYFECDDSNMDPMNGYCIYMLGQSDGTHCPQGGYGTPKNITPVPYTSLDYPNYTVQNTNPICFEYNNEDIVHCKIGMEDKCKESEDERDDPSIVDKDCPPYFEKVGNACIRLTGEDEGANCECQEDDKMSAWFNGTCYRFRYASPGIKYNDDDHFYCPYYLDKYNNKFKYDFLFNHKCYKRETTLSNNKCIDGIEVGSGNDRECLIITDALKISQRPADIEGSNTNYGVGVNLICKFAEVNPEEPTTPPTKDSLFCSTNKNLVLIAKAIGYVILVSCVLGPLLVIALGMMDYFKAVTSSDNEALAKATKSLIRRLIAAFGIFVAPIVVRAALGGINNFTNDLDSEAHSRFGACTKCIFDPNNCQVPSNEEK